MQNDWNSWPQPSRPENGHSTKEIEHRFTDLEAFSKASSADRHDLHEMVDRHEEKLSLHEKAILAILIALGAVLQDKFPKLAGLIKGLI